MKVELKKDLLGLRNMSREPIELILNTAVPIKDLIKRDIKKVPTLRGKAMVTVFYEPSKNRTSFEIAGIPECRYGYSCVSTSSVQKGKP